MCLSLWFLWSPQSQLRTFLFFIVNLTNFNTFILALYVAFTLHLQCK